METGCGLRRTLEQLSRPTDGVLKNRLQENRVSDTHAACLLLPRDITVRFHNFKSQNFKLSVSNPKSKYIVDVSVLSQISNCQGLGRKNKHEMLKTDRIALWVPGIRHRRQPQRPSSLGSLALALPPSVRCLPPMS